MDELNGHKMDVGIKISSPDLEYVWFKYSFFCIAMENCDIVHVCARREMGGREHRIQLNTKPLKSRIFLANPYILLDALICFHSTKAK